MRVYLLTRTKPCNPTIYAATKVCVVAPSSKAARALASSKAGEEGRETWTDSRYSRCLVVRLVSPMVLCAEGEP